MDSEDEQTYPIDFLGQEILPGNYVVGASGHALNIYKVTKITTKMVRIVSLKAKSVQAKKGKLRYSKELLKVDDQIVTFHLIKS